VIEGLLDWQVVLGMVWKGWWRPGNQWFFTIILFIIKPAGNAEEDGGGNILWCVEDVEGLFKFGEAGQARLKESGMGASKDMIFGLVEWRGEVFSPFAIRVMWIDRTISVVHTVGSSRPAMGEFDDAGTFIVLQFIECR